MDSFSSDEEELKKVVRMEETSSNLASNRQKNCDLLQQFLDNWGRFYLDQGEGSSMTLKKAKALELYEKGIHKVRFVDIVWHPSGEETADEIAALLASFLKRIDSFYDLTIRFNGFNPGSWVQEKVDMLLQAIELNPECTMRDARFEGCVPSSKAFQRFLAVKSKSLERLWISDGTSDSQGHIDMEMFIGKLCMRAVWRSRPPDHQLSIFLPLLSLSTVVKTIDVHITSTSNNDELVSEAAKVLYHPLRYHTNFRLKLKGDDGPRANVDISPVLVALVKSPSIFMVQHLFFDSIGIKCPPRDSLETIHAVENANLALKQCTFSCCSFRDVMFDDLGIVNNFGTFLNHLELIHCQVFRNHGEIAFASNSICTLLTSQANGLRKLELNVEKMDADFLNNLGTALMQKTTRVEKFGVLVPRVEETRTEVCAFLQKLGGNQSIQCLKMYSLLHLRNDVMLAEAIYNTLKQNDTIRSVHCFGSTNKPDRRKRRRTCYDSRIGFYLTMNRRGRQLIRSTNVRAGFWPIILERQRDPSALFYFLQRKVPDFFGFHE